jgi:hypothetical protein
MAAMRRLVATGRRMNQSETFTIDSSLRSKHGKSSSGRRAVVER